MERTAEVEHSLEVGCIAEVGADGIAEAEHFADVGKKREEKGYYGERLKWVGQK